MKYSHLSIIQKINLKQWVASVVSYPVMEAVSLDVDWTYERLFDGSGNVKIK